MLLYPSSPVFTRFWRQGAPARGAAKNALSNYTLPKLDAASEKALNQVSPQNCVSNQWTPQRV
eukprot:2859912-Pleurochrysis_carterae.AAC.1